VFSNYQSPLVLGRTRPILCSRSPLCPPWFGPGHSGDVGVCLKHSFSAGLICDWNHKVKRVHVNIARCVSMILKFNFIELTWLKTRNIIDYIRPRIWEYFLFFTVHTSLISYFIYICVTGKRVWHHTCWQQGLKTGHPLPNSEMLLQGWKIRTSWAV
jgi:hypothetical protein